MVEGVKTSWGCFVYGVINNDDNNNGNDNNVQKQDRKNNWHAERERERERENVCVYDMTLINPHT